MESAEEAVPAALDWLGRNKNRKDWFLHVHVWDPHTPYRAPESFGNPFENEPLCDDWITEDVFAKHRAKAGPHSATDLNGMNGDYNEKFPRYPGSLKSLDDVKRFIDNYDCGIKYADSQLGLVLDKLREQGIYDETAIIITSDHGENIGELGLYAEHGTADDITCRIPMIIKWYTPAKPVSEARATRPARSAGGPGGIKRRDKDFHYSIDLLPTLADLLNVERCPVWDGESYASVINGTSEGKPPCRDSLVISQQAHVCQRSARFGDFLYIRTVHDGFQLFDAEMLFNVKDDPHERHDIKNERPELCAKGAKIILDWQDAMMKTSASDRDPMWTVYHEGGPLHARNRDLPYYLERLKTSGRAEAAEALRKKYINEGV
jgi:arylsulfatase A-like enzyme